MKQLNNRIPWNGTDNAHTWSACKNAGGASSTTNINAESNQNKWVLHVNLNI